MPPTAAWRGSNRTEQTSVWHICVLRTWQWHGFNMGTRQASFQSWRGSRAFTAVYMPCTWLYPRHPSPGSYHRGNPQQQENNGSVVPQLLGQRVVLFRDAIYAWLKLLSEGQDVIIMVLLAPIPDDTMTMWLRQFLCKKEYIKWPGDQVGQNLFWQYLRQLLKKPTLVNRRYDV